MGLFDKFKEGLKKTHEKLSHEIKRIVTFSPRMTEAALEEMAVGIGQRMDAAAIGMVLASPPEVAPS